MARALLWNALRGRGQSARAVWEIGRMESPELSLADLSIGQRMILAAQLAAARHWFNAESERRGTEQHHHDRSIGGADLARITDDPQAE
jgi:hypothetical protein